MIAILCSIILILGVFLVIISLCEDYSVHHMALNCVLNLDDCAAGPLCSYSWSPLTQNEMSIFAPLSSYCTLYNCL